MYLARKWHENSILRTITTGRKPPAELTTATRMERTRSERNIKYERDKSITESTQKSSKTKVDDEKVMIEMENSEEVEEDRRLIEDFQKAQMDRIEEHNKKKEAAEATILNQVDNDDNEQETKAAIKMDQRKVPDLQKKHPIQNLRTDDKDDEIKDENEDKEDDVKKLNLPKKLEKVRLADKDKSKILSSRHNVEKSKQEDKELIDTKSAIENMKKPIESTKQSINVTKKSTENTKKIIETTKKLSENTKKVESIKTTVKFKTEATKIVTKSDEKPETSAKLETSTPTLKIKEQLKQPEKTNIKKITKPISKPLKEISQIESEYFI